MTEFDVSAVDLSSILNKDAEEKARQLPDPTGFMLLTVEEPGSILYKPSLVEK